MYVYCVIAFQVVPEFSPGLSGAGNGAGWNQKASPEPATCWLGQSGQMTTSL